MVLVDLDLVATGEVQVSPMPPVAEDTLTEPVYQGVTILPSTFKAKVKFHWAEEAHGANTLYRAVCRICVDPMWLVNDYSRTGLRSMTSAHKDKHYWAATSNTPTPLREGA
jgi:hypothetical protein